MANKIYCHFSFRKVSGSDKALFAVAYYKNLDDIHAWMHETKEMTLWKNDQFTPAIQSFENVLNSIHERQGEFKEQGIEQVVLVTDNSVLYGWIMEPRKNKKYTEKMLEVVDQYRFNGCNEITKVQVVMLNEVVTLEKAYKYCNNKFLIKKNNSKLVSNNGVNSIRLDQIGETFKLNEWI